MEYIWEVCFSSYARPGLEFRERSLMNIAMLSELLLFFNIVPR